MLSQSTYLPVFDSKRDCLKQIKRVIIRLSHVLFYHTITWFRDR